MISEQIFKLKELSPISTQHVFIEEKRKEKKPFNSNKEISIFPSDFEINQFHKP